MDRDQVSCTRYVPVAIILVILMNNTQQSALSDSITCILCVDSSDDCCLALPTRDKCLLLRLPSVALPSKSRSMLPGFGSHVPASL